MKHTLLLPALFLAVLLFCPAHAADSYKVVFETMDCSGNTGFATVGPDEIYKIGDDDCTDPDNPAKKLKQLLIHDGQGSYRIFTLTQDEARNVMQDVKEYMRSRKGVLDRSDSIIISH